MMVCRNGGRGAAGIDGTRPIWSGISSYMYQHFILTNVVAVFFFYPSAVQAILVSSCFICLWKWHCWNRAPNGMEYKLDKCAGWDHYEARYRKWEVARFILRHRQVTYDRSYRLSATPHNTPLSIYTPLWPTVASIYISSLLRSNNKSIFVV